jgi:PAS domain S-box-containing protein
MGRVRDDGENRVGEPIPADREDWFRGLLDKFNDGIYVESLSGEIFEANARACEMLGYTREEMLRLRVPDLLPPDLAESLPALFREVEKQGGLVLEAENIHKNGTMVPVEVSGSIIRYRGETALLVLVRDITERKRAQVELTRKSLDLELAVKRLEEIEAWMTESEKMRSLGTLAAGVAHEFNNILGGIMGCASYLHMRSDAGSEFREYLDMILGASRQASMLSRQLLGVIRKAKSEPRAFSLNDTVRELALMLGQTFPREIEIRTETADDLPMAKGTPAQIYQALLNLCVNARDAMPGGGTLTLQTGLAGSGSGDPLPHNVDQGSFVFAQVLDTGPGILEGIRDRIFEAFFTTKPAGKGTGLGLALVKGVVKNHGGAVEVVSRRGEGARFRLYIPVAADQEADTPPTEPVGLEPGSGRILLVEDDRINRMVMQKILDGHGFEVLAASSGEEALKILQGKQGDVDLVVLDLVMPGLGGVRTLEIIRKRYPGCKVVVLSGLVDEDLTLQLMDRGASAFIQKPIDAGETLAVLKSVLAEREEPGKNRTPNPDSR